MDILDLRPHAVHPRERLERAMQENAIDEARPVVGVVLPDDMMPDEWLTQVTETARSHSAACWRLADLLLFGLARAARFGSVYQEAEAATGLSYQRLANLKVVARRVPISRRRETLSFGHHAEIAALPEAEGDALLAAGEAERWSRNRLRKESVSTYIWYRIY